MILLSSVYLTSTNTYFLRSTIDQKAIVYGKNMLKPFFMSLSRSVSDNMKFSYTNQFVYAQTLVLVNLILVHSAGFLIITRHHGSAPRPSLDMLLDRIRPVNLPDVPKPTRTLKSCV